MSLDWSETLDLSSVASPGLLVDADRVDRNIDRMIEIVDGDASRLRPHVKTHKMSQIVRLQIERGIKKFKAATLAEAEMVASAGAEEVLIAYQMVGPNVERLSRLIHQHTGTRVATVVDHPDGVAFLSRRFVDPERPLSVMIDVDCGMHRTGVSIGPALDRIRDAIESAVGLKFAGLHVYDGHLHDPDGKQRQAEAAEIITQIETYDRHHPSPLIVGGGSPTFATWAHSTPWQCSPGTPVFWDVGYGDSYPDLPFEVAIALVTRVVSKPEKNRICLDLGYKAIASEMPLERRVRLPALPDAKLVGHSEEHLVVETDAADSLALGHAMLAAPRHVCPTIALHRSATVVRDVAVTEERWTVDARDR